MEQTNRGQGAGGGGGKAPSTLQQKPSRPGMRCLHFSAAPQTHREASVGRSHDTGGAAARRRGAAAARRWGAARRRRPTGRWVAAAGAKGSGRRDSRFVGPWETLDQFKSRRHSGGVDNTKSIDITKVAPVLSDQSFFSFSNQLPANRTELGILPVLGHALTARAAVGHAPQLPTPHLIPSRGPRVVPPAPSASPAHAALAATRHPRRHVVTPAGTSSPRRHLAPPPTPTLPL